MNIPLFMNRHQFMNITFIPISWRSWHAKALDSWAPLPLLVSSKLGETRGRLQHHSGRIVYRPPWWSLCNGDSYHKPALLNWTSSSHGGSLIKSLHVPSNIYIYNHPDRVVLADALIIDIFYEQRHTEMADGRRSLMQVWFPSYHCDRTFNMSTGWSDVGGDRRTAAF